MHRQVIRSVVAVLGATLLLTGCARVGERVAERVAGQAVGGEVDVDRDTGDVRVETDEGTFLGGQSLPDAFPSELPWPDGAEVVAGYGVDTEEGRSFTAIAQVSDQDPDAIVAFYEAALPASGWTVEERMELGTGEMTQVALAVAGHGYSGNVAILGEAGEVTVNVILIADTD